MSTPRHAWRAAIQAAAPRLPLPMLALAASYGVYSFNALFVPAWVALVSAAAFELTYVALAVVETRDRRRATLIALAAVVVSVLYNTLAGLFHVRPALLAARPLWADVLLAVLHGLPLAVVAYNVAVLLLHAEPVAARVSRVPVQRRALVRRLVGALRDTRAEAAHFRDLAAQQAAQLAHGSREMDAELRAACAAADDARAQLTQLARELETVRAQLARSQAEAAQLADAAAQAGELDLRGLAQWAGGLGASTREIARRLARPETTVRGWVKEAARPTSAAD